MRDIKIKWSKRDYLFLLMGGFYGIGFTFEGMAQYMNLKTANIFALLARIVALIIALLIKKLNV